MEWKSSLIKFTVNLMHPLRLLQQRKIFSEKEINWVSSLLSGIKNISKGREELIVIEYGQPIKSRRLSDQKNKCQLYAVDNDFQNSLILQNTIKETLQY